MAKTDVDRLARELVRLMTDMVGLHGELATRMRDKLEAIKQANSDRIHSITARELVLVKRATEREGLRRQIVKRILEGLGEDGEQYRQMRLSALAERFPEPRRNQLLCAAAALRKKVEEIDLMRVTTTLVTHGMLRHLDEVFKVMTSGGKSPEVYLRSGQRATGAGPANVFEAVG